MSALSMPTLDRTHEERQSAAARVAELNGQIAGIEAMQRLLNSGPGGIAQLRKLMLSRLSRLKFDRDCARVIAEDR